MTSHQPHHHETAPLHDAPDAWHDHSHDPDQPQHAHAEVGNAHLVVGVGVGAFLLVVASIVAVYGFYMMSVTEQLNRQERHDGNSGQEAWLVKETRRDIEPSRVMWVDHETVQLPLDTAIERVLGQYGKK